MSEQYDQDQAMELFGIYSVNAFRQLARKYPDVFVVMRTTKTKKGRKPWYDKAALDEFAKTYKQKRR